MTTGERFEKHIQDASADDLRAMVRAARLAMVEYNSQIMRAEGLHDSIYEALVRAYDVNSKLRVTIDSRNAAKSARPWVENGGTAEFKRLVSCAVKSPLPF